MFNTQLQYAHMAKEAQALQRDATVGHSVRAVTHEINNLLGIASPSVKRLRHSAVAMPKDIDWLGRALAYMSKVSSLVLDGLGDRQATKRLISLAELRDDVQLLLGGAAGAG